MTTDEEFEAFVANNRDLIERMIETQKSAAMMTKQMRMFQSATNLIPLSMPSTAEPV